MANVLVKASGLNRRPSCASRVKTGKKETVMMSSEKNSGFPTSLAASMTMKLRSPGRPACSHFSRRLWAFSIITMAASTMAPMAMAMPPSDMMFEFRSM